MAAVTEIPGKPLDDEVLAPTVSTGISGTLLTADGTTFAIAALITVEGYPVRFRLTGSTPTSLVGHLIQPGSSIELKGAATVRDFRCIDTVSGASSVYVTTYVPHESESVHSGDGTSL